VSSWGTPALVLVFAAAGVATWLAGIYLSKATDVLDDRFNLGDAVGGMRNRCGSEPRARS